MNDWYMDVFEWLEAETALTQAFDFIFDTLQQLFSAIFKNWLFFVPLFLFLLLSVMYFVGWVIMESSQYAGGSPFANPNRQFGRMANPNRQYETNMPLWSALGKKAIWKHRQNQREQERQAIETANSKLAEEFFYNNPNAYKINIDGKTFWRTDWQKHRWDKDGRMRHTVTYKRNGDEYVPIKESHSVTEYEDPD